MTGYIIDAAGTRTALPVLTAWEITRTDGSACGTFSMQFMAEASSAAALRRAATVSMEENGVQFCGVVDEMTLSLTAMGLCGTLSGRDFSARLLDSQCRAAEFQSAQLTDILARYVRPYFGEKISAAALAPVANFSVSTGESCWQALEGYCRHAGNVRPNLAPDGTLRIGGAECGVRRVLTLYNAPTDITLRETRYGIISEQTVLDFTKKSIETVKNPRFDGKCVKVAARAGSMLKSTWHTAAQRIARSMEKRTMLCVTVPTAFAAEPLDTVSVNLAEMGIQGEFTVTEAATQLDAQGLCTKLTMRAKEG